ncbi:hypothetical protein MKZ02_20145 [Pseudobacillus sp. FSL P4-0506]|uniref:hypothetical protein n=1 Tax=Pseudobacillus sp. FSL P4-0506 TaxID=2921576 RepID=UPI0030FB3D1D
MSVCKEWSEDFEIFREWALSNGYEDNLTLERKDCNGDYEPSNCSWITKQEQASNTRQSRHITIDGVTKTLASWCREYKMNYATVFRRMKDGMTPKEALTTPPRKRKSKK